jgi:acyl carrier protein
VLDALLRREGEADFLVLCSSINALLGGVGAVDYCSANAFQDAYAESRSGSTGCRTVSINWDTWQEVGMAVDTEVPADIAVTRRQALSTGITPAEGVEAFERVLATSLPQVGIITRDLRRLVGQASDSMRASTPPAAVQPDISGSEPGTTSESSTEEAIRSIWSELLGMEEVRLDDNFFTLGGHSLLATGILSRIRSQFGVHLPVRVIFEAPTVKELAFVVEARLWRERAPNAGDEKNEGEREVIEL